MADYLDLREGEEIPISGRVLERLGGLGVDYAAYIDDLINAVHSATFERKPKPKYPLIPTKFLEGIDL